MPLRLGANEVRLASASFVSCCKQAITRFDGVLSVKDFSPTQDTKQPYELTSPSGLAITTT